MTTLITLTNVGSDAGPFNLYSNADDYDQPFDTDISADDLIAGYTTPFVPNDATIIRVISMGVCGNHIDIAINDDPCLIVGTAAFAVPTTTTTTTVAVSCTNYINVTDILGDPYDIGVTGIICGGTAIQIYEVFPGDSICLQYFQSANLPGLLIGSSCNTTTTTTTAICERPEGLTNGKLIKAYRIYEDPLSYFYSVSVIAATGAFQIFRTETGTETVEDHIQYSSLTIGEILYALWDNTNCEVVEDGYYWFQSNTDNSLTYFNSVTQINIVTVVGGEITAITPYTWIP